MKPFRRSLCLLSSSENRSQVRPSTTPKVRWFLRYWNCHQNPRGVSSESPRKASSQPLAPKKVSFIDNHTRLLWPNKFVVRNLWHLTTLSFLDSSFEHEVQSFIVQSLWKQPGSSEGHFAPTMAAGAALDCTCRESTAKTKDAQETFHTRRAT